MENCKKTAILVFSLFFLTGCEKMLAFGEQLGFEPAEQKNARLAEEGKAVGNACRHAGRAIEDCYTIYSWLPRAGIFEGWLAMDQYMREHSIKPVEPTLPPPENPNKKRTKKVTKKKAADSEESAAAEKPAES